MDPFLPEKLTPWNHWVPPPCSSPRYSSEENKALSALDNALTMMNKTFGPYQTDAIIRDELERCAGGYYPLVCNDGTCVSAQANPGSCRMSNDDAHVFTHVEILINNNEEPECISAHDLMALLAKHGGVKTGHCPPLDFGRDPERGHRRDDEGVLDHKMRKARNMSKVSSKKEIRPPVNGWLFEYVERMPWEDLPSVRVRAEAINNNGKRCREFTTSEVVQVHHDDGAWVIETQNSIYFGRERDRLVAGTNLVARDGGVSLSIFATPVIG